MQKRASGGVFSCSVVSECEGETVLRISGDGAYEAFRLESGGHRWQRVPPTEQKGRRHSSTFTVAVMIEGAKVGEFRESDVEIETTVGHGPGGQHRNKTATAVRATHKPTGVSVFIQSERSQAANKKIAMEELRCRIERSILASHSAKVNESRKMQIGTGERGDKIRTVQEQNNVVVNHTTGKKCGISGYIKGDIWSIQ